MNQNMVYVSIDFNDASYHRCASNQLAGEAPDFLPSRDIESLYVRQVAAVNLGKRGQTLICQPSSRGLYGLKPQTRQRFARLWHIVIDCCKVGQCSSIVQAGSVSLAERDRIPPHPKPDFRVLNSEDRSGSFFLVKPLLI
jgi:hypothetical protein